MSVNLHCFEIKNCPKKLNCLCPCLGQREDNVHSNRRITKKVHEDKRDPSTDSIKFDLTDANPIPIDNLSTEPSKDAVFMLLDEMASVICISAANSVHDDLQIKHYYRQPDLSKLCPHMLALIIRALVSETIKASRRRQVTVSVPNRGVFLLTCWPFLENNDAIGCSLQIKRRLLTVGELAKFIK